jgi:hypothetical protein
VLHAGSMRLFEARYPIVTSADLLATQSLTTSV